MPARKAALKFRDFGKLAATFCDLGENRAVRVAARESARARSRELYPSIERAGRQQVLAYRELPDGELFDFAWVRVALDPRDLPGSKAPRMVCAECGETVNFGRIVERAGRLLCRACAGERYYQPL